MYRGTLATIADRIWPQSGRQKRSAAIHHDGSAGLFGPVFCFRIGHVFADVNIGSCLGFQTFEFEINQAIVAIVLTRAHPRNKMPWYDTILLLYGTILLQ